MADEQYRLRVSPKTGEFEIEGSEEFVEKYWGELRPLIDRRPAADSEEADAGVRAERPSERGDTKSLPENFGEFRNSFRKLSQLEEMLVAGYFVQSSNEDAVFTNREANQLLIEQGVKITNPSQCTTDNKNKGLAFKVKARTFRVSEKGKQRISELTVQE